MKLVKYKHHNRTVVVRDDLKGRHREYCLCYYPCKKFKPDSPDNCPIAALLFRTCIITGTTTPVFECECFEGDLTT